MNPSIVPTRVRPAAIDRMTWIGSPPRESTRRRRGSVDRTVLACGRIGTLHPASSRDGSGALVLRGTPDALRRRAADHRQIAELPRSGITVPTVHGLDGDGLWLDRIPWADAPARISATVVDRYVVAALDVAVNHGTVVATGTPHVTDAGGLVVEDTFVAARLETDERHTLGALWHALVDLDAVALADALSTCSGRRTPQITESARRATLSLRADWTAVALGLTFRHVATATTSGGDRSAPLVLLADELLHRLDLAWATGSTVTSLTSPAVARATLEHLRVGA